MAQRLLYCNWYTTATESKFCVLLYWSFQWISMDVLMVLWWRYCVSFHLFDNKFLLDYHQFIYFREVQPSYATQNPQAPARVCRVWSSDFVQHECGSRAAQIPDSKLPVYQVCRVPFIPCVGRLFIILINKFSFVERNLWQCVLALLAVLGTLIGCTFFGPESDLGDFCWPCQRCVCMCFYLLLMRIPYRVRIRMC